MDKILTLSASQGYWLLAIYGVVMIAVTYFFARWKRYRSIQGFLVAERNVKWWLGSTRIAWNFLVYVSKHYCTSDLYLACTKNPRENAIWLYASTIHQTPLAK